MEIGAASSTAGDADEAARELCGMVGDIETDLAVVWISSHHSENYERVVSRICAELNPRNIIGCTCESVIGPDEEIEGEACAALWVARMPSVRIMPFVLDQNDFVTLRSPEDWRDRLGVAIGDAPTFIMLPDPFSIQLHLCLRVMDEVFPGSTIVGGVASAAREAGKNRLFLNDQILRQGMVGVSLTGAFNVSAIVSQGCRPIGSTYVITKAESNVILELGGRHAYDVLRELHESASSSEQDLIRTGLHVGRAVDEHLESFGPGDFLIRNVAGVVENKGLAVTDFLRAGQTIQFHVRDAMAADQHMRATVTSAVAKMPGTPAGGLLFNCNGRGTRLFEDRSHDIAIINEVIPDCPVAGFFAAGEIGPVAGKSFLHGLTSSLILFQDDETA